MTTRVTLSASAWSLFLHGAAALGICLWCRPGQLRPVPAEYVTVISIEATAEPDVPPAPSPGATPAPAPAVNTVAWHPGESHPDAAQRPRLSGPAKIKKRISPAESRQTPAGVEDRPAESSFSAAPSKGEGHQALVADGGTAAAAADTQTAGPKSPEDAKADPAGRTAAYLQHNYDYIREIVMRNLSFPVWAKKMRLTGATEVSFIVGTAGDVEDIRIEKSTGHELLDMNVVAAVQKSAPFPAPPEKARIALPVVFRLR